MVKFTCLRRLVKCMPLDPTQDKNIAFSISANNTSTVNFSSRGEADREKKNDLWRQVTVFCCQQNLESAFISDELRHVHIAPYQLDSTHSFVHSV